MKDISTIRRTVATMANQLHKLGYSLSNAFRTAWRRVKATTSEGTVSGRGGGHGQGHTGEGHADEGHRRIWAQGDAGSIGEYCNMKIVKVLLIQYLCDDLYVITIKIIHLLIVIKFVSHIGKD